ncbi:MAG: hypothetical protein GY713_04085, partial [Actinomycetia bacterium]|nr:hypothetical protein [Actinomycetes bacterium]
MVALLSLFVGTDSSWSGDEGAALHQARILVEHDRWGLPSTLPAVDPEGDWFPIRHSWPVESGMAPLAKRPLYPVLVSVGWLVSPKWGPVAVSVLGAVVAAAASGLIARRIRPALDRPTLWVAGLGSPLLFDSQIVIAHTLGAAAVTLAVLNALRFFDHHRRLDLAGVFAFVTLAGLVRSEAVLAALALALAAPIATRFTRAGRQVGVVALAAAGAAWMLERFTLGLIGVRVAPLVPGGSGAGWVADRWTGFWATWFQPGYRDDPLELMLVGAVVLMAVAVVLARKRAGVELVTALVGAAAGLILARLLLGGGATVPGIVWAFPLAPLGVMAQKRAHLDDLTVRFVLITAALFAGAVLATQYPTGGTWEWGWRYFAIAVG